MANVNVRFSATCVDELGTEASTTSYAEVPDTSTIAAVASAQQAWVSALDAVTATQIIRSSIAVIPALPGGIKAAPAAGARVEQTGVINFRATGSAHRFGQDVPGLANALITAGKLDLANVNVEALVALLTSAVSGGAFTNTAGQALTAVADALLSFRKRRKQLSKTSAEVPA